MSEYIAFEIGVRADVDGFYGFILKSKDKEQVYASKRFDDFDTAMKDAWEKWQAIKN